MKEQPTKNRWQKFHLLETDKNIMKDILILQRQVENGKVKAAVTKSAKTGNSSHFQSENCLLPRQIKVSTMYTTAHRRKGKEQST